MDMGERYGRAMIATALGMEVASVHTWLPNSGWLGLLLESGYRAGLLSNQDTAWKVALVAP
jgi:hypothetical protein